MSEILKKVLLAGIGAVILTKEKAEKLANELVRAGELNESEQAKFVKELMGKGEKWGKEWEKKFDALAETAIRKLNLPTRQEFLELKAMVEKLLNQ